ncbi:MULTISPECIES: hypothetical protein [Rhodomicrobium]|uniref:hypothetical protein n=1 Tax=Rhodomicrobium TaxID=1068 RepID=UPI000F73A76B|nr:MULTISPECIES: hypothetical protein [Rhodomicrobium]
METSNFFKIFGILGGLCTIGAFLLELNQYLGQTKSQESVVISQVTCDWTLYIPAVTRIRKETEKPSSRYSWLGADPNFTYYYDYQTDDVICTLQRKPLTPQVHPSRSQAPARPRQADRNRQVIVSGLLAIILFSAIGLKIIGMIRRGRGGGK